MADETHKLQKDPPEGSRKTVEHELERQSRNSTGGQAGKRDDRDKPAPNGRK